MKNEVDTLADQICDIEEKIGKLEAEMKTLRRRQNSHLTSARERIAARDAITQKTAEVVALKRRADDLRFSFIHTGAVPVLA